MGHTKARCDAELDRSDLCCNCGQKGHKATNCKEKTKCVLCEEADRPCNHRLGEPRCTAPPSKGQMGVFRRSPTKSPRNYSMGTETSIQVEPNTEGNGDRRETPQKELGQTENMETEELENSVESELVEDHYGDENTSDQHQLF